MTNSDFPIESFSLTNGLGPNIDNVPMLLRRFADQLEKIGPVCVCDLVFHTDVEAEGYMHGITAYFTRDPKDIDSSRWASDEAPPLRSVPTDS